jgi:plasmid stability protein
MKKSVRMLLGTGAVALIVVAIAAGYWLYRFGRYTPAEVRADLRAAVAARDAPQPVARFLELRYGSMADPANRRKAFLDFFNPGHIEGLQIIVRHTPDHMKASNTLAMAEWVASYRRTMTAQEKAALGAYFKSEAGRARLRQATSRYLAQDVHYRAHTAPVIRELMMTVAAAQEP